MRAIDVLECAAFGHTPRQALRLGYLGSALKWTAEAGGAPVAMLGVVPVCAMTGEGSPWLLGTRGADAVSSAFVRLAAGPLSEMAALFPRLENRAHQTNTRSLRWLSRLGFTVEREVEMIGGEPFVRFWRDWRV
jgi:hypothetical protein